MAVVFYSHPCLLLEAEELLFSYANRSSIQGLAGSGPYGIPASEVENMMQEACCGLNRDQETLRFYFQQYPLPGTNGSTTCLARFLVFTFSDWSNPEPAAVAHSILDAWKKVSSCPYVFTNVSAFCLSSAPWEGVDPPPFANGLGQLPIPMPLKEKLLETFSDLPAHLSALMELLLPVAEYLRHALVPWVDRAAPLRQSWERQMLAQSPDGFILEFLRAKVPWSVQNIEAALLYFIPDWILPGISEESRALKMLVGAGRMPQNPDGSEFTQREYLALRLLGSPTRIKMLRALKETPMTSREMSRNLELHLGTVSRDVSSMQDAGLLNIEFHGNRRRYSVNYATLRALAQHLVELCPEAPTEA